MKITLEQVVNGLINDCKDNSHTIAYWNCEKRLKKYARQCCEWTLRNVNSHLAEQQGANGIKAFSALHSDNYPSELREEKK